MVGELYAREVRRVKAGPGDRYPTDNIYKRVRQKTTGTYI